MNELILQYKQAKKMAQQIQIDPENAYIDEAPVVRGMISDLNYALEWMKTGKQPNSYSRGIGVKSAYDRRLLLNMELFPCLDLDTTEERTLTDHKKKIVRFVLGELTERQLTCFLLHEAHLLTEEEVAKELGLKRTTVQEHILVAKKKIARIVEENQLEQYL